MRRAVEASKKSAEAPHKAYWEAEVALDNLLKRVKDKQFHSTTSTSARQWEGSTQGSLNDPRYTAKYRREAADTQGIWCHLVHTSIFRPKARETGSLPLPLFRRLHFLWSSGACEIPQSFASSHTSHWHKTHVTAGLCFERCSCSTCAEATQSKWRESKCLTQIFSCWPRCWPMLVLFQVVDFTVF